MKINFSAIKYMESKNKQYVTKATERYTIVFQHCKWL